MFEYLTSCFYITAMLNKEKNKNVFGIFTFSPIALMTDRPETDVFAAEDFPEIPKSSLPNILWKTSRPPEVGERRTLIRATASEASSSVEKAAVSDIIENVSSGMHS
jgi:hypothetical protein